MSSVAVADLVPLCNIISAASLEITVAARTPEGNQMLAARKQRSLALSRGTEDASPC